MQYTATGSNRRISFAQVAGSPATPSMTSLPVRSFAVAESRETINDPSITGYGVASKTRLGNRSVAGNVVVSYKPRVTDPWLESFFGNSYANNVITNGKENVPILFEDTQTDAATPYSYSYHDCFANTLNLNISDGNGSTLEFGFVGVDFKTNTTLLDSTPTPATDHDPYVHLDCVFKMGSTVIGYMTSFSFAGTRNLTANNVLGSKQAYSITKGNMGLTGTFTVLAKDSAMMTRYFNETREPLVVEATNGTFKDVWTIHNPLFTAVSTPLDSDGATIQTVNWVGDPTADFKVLSHQRVDL
ncbi:phage tail tube protein [Acidovorax sp.]|uniref:phage tail tube protein n=1 Tax=Acidovorax sp. TaxID=1872122 RepID=UPI00391EE45C